MILSLVSAVMPLVLKLIGFWLDKKKVDAEMTKSYYNFLEQLDKKGLAKVSNLMGVEKERARLEEELRNDRLTRDKKQT